MDAETAANPFSKKRKAVQANEAPAGSVPAIAGNAGVDAQDDDDDDEDDYVIPLRKKAASVPASGSHGSQHPRRPAASGAVSAVRAVGQQQAATLDPSAADTPPCSTQPQSTATGTLQGSKPREVGGGSVIDGGQPAPAGTPAPASEAVDVDAASDAGATAGDEGATAAAVVVVAPESAETGAGTAPACSSKPPIARGPVGPGGRPPVARGPGT